MVRQRAATSAILALLLLVGCSRQPTVQAREKSVKAEQGPAAAPNEPQPASENEKKNAAPAVAQGKFPEKVDAPHLPNAFRVHAKVISGGQPAGEEAFAALKALGVRTVISVDGAKPDVARAHKFGMRYVHLPHGYDGIPDERVKELAKAVRDLPGPIYLHCHHGKHRSPAATAAACVTAGFLAPPDADKLLAAAGTSPNYRGLFQAAESARPVDQAVLDALAVEFQETAALPPLAETMVEIEHIHDRLKAIDAAKWQPPADQPALDPAHEALLLKEQFAELLRTDMVMRQSARFIALTREGEAAAAALETVLHERGSNTDTGPAAEAFARVNKNCTTCHREIRDVPLGEKPKAAGAN